MSSILFYISGHGYGHSVRCGQIIEALQRARPALRIYVKTTAPSWLFPPVVYFPRATDVGFVQADSLSLNVAATVKACRDLHDAAPKIIQEEIAFIREHRINGVVGDIPPLCFEIAKQAKIPAVAIANFTWSHIYRAYAEEYPAFLRLTDEIDRCYCTATAALVLPYSCPMEIFPRRVPIPWIARVSALSKEQARAKFGFLPSARIVLLSFGGLGLERLPWQQLKTLVHYQFVTTGGSEREEENIRVLSAAREDYVDLIRAADAIIAKPGYGIVADAIAHRAPVLYTDRGDFPEDAQLIEALHQCAAAVFVPQSDLLAGDIGPFLERLLATPVQAAPPDLSGARAAAESILSISCP